MFFYVYLCKNKQVMYFKFEPSFVILSVMQRIRLWLENHNDFEFEIKYFFFFK